MAAMQGADMLAGLRAACPALTLQQVYRLTEHHHDDWITGGQSADTYHVLETLKRIVDRSVRPICSLMILPACACLQYLVHWM